MITQESFYTYRTARKPTTELLAEIGQLTEQKDYDQAALREIELHLTRGHEHFQARRYHPALKEYLQVRLLIYRLLDPDAPDHGGIDVVPPVRPEFFDRLLSEVVGRVGRFHPPPRPAIPGPVVAVDPPPDLPIGALNRLGVTVPGRAGRADPAARIDPGVDLARPAPVVSDRRFRFVAFESADRDRPPTILEYRLGDASVAERISSDYYAKRAAARTLEELGSNALAIMSPGRFEVDLPHHYHFTVHVALAKTYAAIGRFEQALASLRTARGYRFLNRAIEAPFLWIETARVYLAWGNQLYRLNDRETARGKYAAILRVADTVAFDPASELYQPAVFSAMRDQVAALLPALDARLDPAPAVNPQLEAIVREAYQRQRMIDAQLNYYGVPASPISIFRFRYLQAVARYFADQAIKAEREYINFWTNAEQETQSVIQLEQALEVAQETVELENRRVSEARAMADVAETAVNIANIRLANTRARREQYATLGRDLIALDRATAHASGGFSETEGGYDVYLHSAGGTVNLGDVDYVIMRNAAQRRGEINYAMELANLDRVIAELEANRLQAAEQVAVAQARTAVADQGVRIAEARLRHSAENLEYARNKTFTPELWFNLASTLREISDIYLQRAIEIAHLMQSAYNFEFDQDLRVIKNNYANRDELSGLLSADLLKTDIDYFTFHRITQVAIKQIPAKTYWSIAERHPFLLFEFRRTGVLQFETQLAELDELFPGTYLQKLKTVEVVFEGLIGADGVHGTFANNGISNYRTRGGTAAVRIQPRETLLLSAHELRYDAVVFRPSEEVRGVFEDAGVAGIWTLEVPRGTNDLNYETIRDIRIVFYFESFYDEGLAAAITAALPAEGTWQRSYSLATEFPDAFFRFQDTGTLNFDSRAGDFPLHHANLEIRSLSVLALPAGELEAAVRARLKRAGDPDPDEFVTDAETGIFASDPGAAGNPLNSFVGASPLGEWVFSMDLESNPIFVDDGGGQRPPRIVGIRDTVINVEYGYQRRTAEPLPS
jgi:hypothetical protein